MLDSIAAHVKLVQGNDIFRKIIADVVVGTKFAIDGFIGSKQISYLNIQFFTAFLADKVYFFFAGFADGNRISSAKQLQINDIF